VQELEQRALRLPTYPPAAVAAAVEGAQALLGSVACDRATLEWFARDRKLHVEQTVAKARRYVCTLAIAHSSSLQVRSYLEWRADGFAGIEAADVSREAATGKAVLLPERDLVRSATCAGAAAGLTTPPQLGRPVVLVRVALNKVDERELRETERLCVFLMDQALELARAEGRETVMTVFDLRGFKCVRGVWML